MVPVKSAITIGHSTNCGTWDAGYIHRGMMDRVALHHWPYYWDHFSGSVALAIRT